MTQLELAREILVPRVTYTHYELGKRTPDLDTIIRLARYFQVSLDFLTGCTSLRPSLEQWLSDRNLSRETAGSAGDYKIDPNLAGQRVADSPPEPVGDHPVD